MAVFHHIRKLKIAQRTHGGIADVGSEGTARVCVLEEIRHRFADEHFVPDADSHRRAFLGINRLASEIFLVKPQIEHVTFTSVLMTGPAMPS
jgi:hypothetical protein